MTDGQATRETPGQLVTSCLSYTLTYSSLGLMVVGLLGSWQIVLLPILFLLARFSATLLHELGHAIGAIAAGWRVSVIVAWPVAFHAPSGRIIFSDNVNKTDIGGYVLATPRTASRDTPLRLLLMLSFGPLASLIAGIWMAQVAFAVVAPPPELWPGAPMVARTISFSHFDPSRCILGLALGFSCLNFGAFVRTAIPAPASSANDGRKILDTLRPSGTSENRTVVWIAGLLHFNMRLRDIPGWMYDIARARAAPSSVEAHALDMWDIGCVLDAETVDVARARRMIESFRATHGENDWLLTCDAYLAAVYESDAARAADMIAALKEPSASRAMIPAAKAALAARLGDLTRMAEKLVEMDASLAKDSPFPDATFRDIRRRIEAVGKQAA